MRFIVDECAGPAVAHWLRARSHDVFSVHEQARGISDEEVLAIAFAQNRVVIPCDKDFGDKVYREQISHRGVVYFVSMTKDRHQR